MPVDFQLPQDPPALIQPQPAATPSFDDQYARARALANGGQPELALSAYDALLARSPGNVDVLLGRGIVHARLEHWRESEADLTAAAAAAPDYADVWAALARTYRWSGRPAQAEQAWNRVLALQPENADALFERASARQAMATPVPPQPRAAHPDAAIAAGFAWVASAGAGWTDAGSGPRWNDQTLAIRRYGQHGSIAFEALRARRFGLHDAAWALDAYTSLWAGAYANLRYQRAPAARLFPANSGRVELYQALGNGWEASLSEDVLGFAGRVNIHGLALGKYAGNWYVQLRHQNVVSDALRGSGERLLGRYYYRDDSFVEASVNSGRSDDPQSLVGGRARSGGGNLIWTHYWTPRWGSRLQASFARDGGADQRGLSFTLYRRW